MTKRIISFLMTAVMLLGIMTAGIISAAAESSEETTTGQEVTTAQETVADETVPEGTTADETPENVPEETIPEVTEPEETGFSASDECIRILKLEEGFSKKPYWDYSQWTVGYGTKCPEDMREYYSTYGITEAEAETLLRNHLEYVYKDLNKFIEKNELTLTQNQFDALVLMSYNCGTSWAFDKNGTLYNAVVSGATGNELIRAFGRWCKAGGEVKAYLLRRRLSESNIYLNGVYSQTPPENYCYVIYDANGGAVSPSSQTYDSNLTAVPNTEAVYTGYTFVGWFTAAEGGTQVTVLDASTKSATLYAHWVDAEGKAPENTQQTTNVKVIVTDTDVNLRKGPGTNYTIVGTANTGDRFTITAVAEGSGYTWGQFDGGWICLKYTNYDTVIQGGGSSGNDTTEPTEPEPTNPQPTDPEPTDPEKPGGTAVTGTVKADGGLCVRSGPSTGYTAVRYLANGSKVEILEQKTVGSMAWGKISDGWVSMKYVILDNVSTEPEPTVPEATEPEPTEPETTEPESTVPETTEPEPTEPETTEPEPTEPETTEPETTVQKGTVKADGGLRVRSGPGVSYAIVRYLYDGSKVEVTETKTVGSVTWGKVADGWISMEYVKLDAGADQTPQLPQTPTPPAEPEKPQVQTGTVKVDSYLRIRNGPGTSYAVCGYLYSGDKVEITETKTVGATVWGRTAKGWISMDYVVLSGSSGSGSSGTTTPTKVTKTVNTDCLRIRSSAGTENSIVGYLYYGTKVEILETKTVGGAAWGRTSQGWISMDYVK